MRFRTPTTAARSSRSAPTATACSISRKPAANGTRAGRLGTCTAARTHGWRWPSRAVSTNMAVPAAHPSRSSRS